MSAKSLTELATVRVSVVFHAVDARRADTIAAEIVSRAHELANMPDHECDVDVSVESAPPDDSGADGGDAR